MTGYKPHYVRSIFYLLQYLHSHLGAMAPDMLPQIEAYIALRCISAIVHEFQHGHSLSAATRHIRREMNRTGLPRAVDTRGLPLYVRCFMLLLKCRLYFPAVLATKIRMRQTAAMDQ